MAKNQNTTSNVPEGFEEIGSGKFFKFENVGDSFRGFCLGIKEQKGQKYKQMQTLIIARQTGTDEVVMVPVKTALKDRILELEEGMEFFIRYDGEKVSNAGQKYKDFTFAISRAPF